MKEIQINEFIDNYSSYFSEEMLTTIAQQLREYPDEMYSRIMQLEGLKSPTTALVLAFFALDRLYLKDYILGIFKLALCSILIWTIIDLSSVKNRTYNMNMKILAEALSGECSEGIALGGKTYTPEQMKSFAKEAAPHVINAGKVIKNGISDIVDTF